MTKSNKSLWSIALLLLTAVILAGCTAVPAATQAPAEAQATIDVDAIKEEIAKTVIAEITEQAVNDPAEQTSSAKAGEAQPTQTPWVITATTQPGVAAPASAATFTPIPPILPTKAPASGGVALPTITPTYYTDVAKLSNLTPASYSVFEGGYDFDINWTVQNTGHRDWNTQFYYKIKLHDGTEIGPVFLPALTIGDTFSARADMVAPHEAGNYVNTLSVINDDGVVFFSSAFIFTVR